MALFLVWLIALIICAVVSFCAFLFSIGMFMVIANKLGVPNTQTEQREDLLQTHLELKKEIEGLLETLAKLENVRDVPDWWEASVQELYLQLGAVQGIHELMAAMLGIGIPNEAIMRETPLMSVGLDAISHIAGIILKKYADIAFEVNDLLLSAAYRATNPV